MQVGTEARYGCGRGMCLYVQVLGLSGGGVAVGAVLASLLILLLKILFPTGVYTTGHICSISSFNLGTGKGGSMSPILRGILRGVGESCRRKSGIALHFPANECRFFRGGTTSHRCCVSGRSRAGPGGMNVTVRGVGGLALSKRKSSFVFRNHVVPISLLCSRGYVLGSFGVSFRGPRVTRVRVMRGSMRGNVAFRMTP